MDKIVIDVGVRAQRIDGHGAKPRHSPITRQKSQGSKAGRGNTSKKFLREARVESQGSSAMRCLCVFVAGCEEVFRGSRGDTERQRKGQYRRNCFLNSVNFV
jgi:hypothetical protein